MTSASSQVLPPQLRRRLLHHHGDALVEEVSRTLVELDESVVEQEVTIVFGGHFSCGKSSLLNALIGRPLLPTDDFPETGVACWMSSGSRDGAVAVTASGATRSLPLCQEALAEVVSLVDRDGEYRGGVGAVEQVRITLAGEVLPPRVRWVDSPGINDSEAMGARARQASRSADVLVWVVDSRRPVSETEQQFLYEHQEAQGGGAVVFAVNVFLPSDTPQEWARFLAERADYHRERIATLACWSNDGGANQPDVVFVSARGAASEGFGGPQVRRLLTELGEHSHPRVRAARLRRAAARCERLADTVVGRIQPEHARLDRERELVDERRKTAERQRSAFHRSIRELVEGCFARHRAQAEQCGPSVVAELATGPLRWDDSYGTSLTAKFEAVADALAADLVESVARRASRHRHSPPAPATLSRLTSLLRPATLTVTVPNSPVGVAKGGMGAILGGAIGTVLLPGFGTALGALIGGAAGAGSGADDAVTRDRTAAQASARAAAAASIVALAGKQREARELLLASCTPLDAAAEDPCTEPLDALFALESNLRRKAQECARGADAASAPGKPPAAVGGSA